MGEIGGEGRAGQGQGRVPTSQDVIFPPLLYNIYITVVPRDSSEDQSYLTM